MCASILESDAAERPVSCPLSSILVTWHPGKFTQRGYQYDLSDEDFEAHFVMYGDIEDVEPLNESDGHHRCRVYFIERSAVENSVASPTQWVKREDGKMVKVRVLADEDCIP